MPEQRKLVTVLFADITGSTARAEDLDPEDVRALMGRYYVHAHRVVGAYGGTLEKFIGDAIMAVFGLPHVHGDDAERALAAALALKTAVAQDPALRDVSLRIGVNTGEVVATSDPSSGDFLVTGDAVNVAARLQQCGTPNEILASERTYMATSMAYLFGSCRDLEVKGKREPVRAFPVVGVRTTRQAQRPLMVGRRRDLSRLALLQASVLEECRPQLVSIIAPAGTGKTRLLEEFLESLDPADGLQVAAGRCLPYGQTLTYWPLRGLLRDLVGEVARERVFQAFERGGNDCQNASRLADLVMVTLGAESEEIAERESTFNAWRCLIETLTRENPRIVVFEDLHWASESLLDLVEHIMHPRSRAPLLLIVTSRPELLDRRPTWGGGRGNFTSLDLPPLTEGQMTELVDGLGSDLPKGMRQRIVERSDGNPFFATELIRGLSERSVAGQPQAADAIPDTVHAAVLARLDLLSQAERSALQAAAVAGRAFQAATLEALLDDLDAHDLESALDGVLRRDLIAPSEGGTYAFRHTLIRDVAYGTLSRTDRIRMHAAVAIWLEGYAADRLDEFTELIAYHYREAAMLARSSIVPLPLPFDPGRAVRFLERAGELASRSGAFGEARNHLKSAIALAAAEDHGRLFEKLGDCAVRGDTARAAYREALVQWRGETKRDPLIGARLLRKLLVVNWRWGAMPLVHNDELVEMADEASRLAEEAGDDDELWRIRVARLYRHMWRNVTEGISITAEEADEGRATALAAAEHAERRRDWESFSGALDAYMTISQMIGLHQAVIEGAQRRLGVPGLTAAERGDALGMMAVTYIILGNYDRCLSMVEEEVARVRRGDPIAYLRFALLHALFAAWVTGRWSELHHLTSLVQEALRQTSGDYSPGAPNTYFSVLHVALARVDRVAADAATATLEGLLHESDQFGQALLDAYREDDPSIILRESPSFNQYLLLFALVFLTERSVPPPAELVGAIRQAMVLGPAGALDRCTEIAEALIAHDPLRLSRAIQAAEEHGLLPHAARMRIVLAQMADDSSHLDQARPVLERLEDHQFLRRLEAMIAALR